MAEIKWKMIIQETITYFGILGATILVWGIVSLGVSAVVQGIIYKIKSSEKLKTSKGLEKEKEEHNERLRRSRLIDGKEFLPFDAIPRTHYRAEIKCNNCSFYQEFSVSKGTTQEDFKKTVDCMRCDVKLDYKI